MDLHLCNHDHISSVAHLSSVGKIDFDEMSRCKMFYSNGWHILILGSLLFHLVVFAISASIGS